MKKIKVKKLYVDTGQYLEMESVTRFLDNVEYSKGDFINRNKICVNNSEHFLTVPVSKKHSNSLINSIPLPVDSNWKNKHILTITQNYKKCDFYDEFFPPILNCIQNHEGLLCDLNIKLIKIICKSLNISSTFMKSSDFNIDQSLKSTERLIYLLNFNHISASLKSKKLSISTDLSVGII